jgi:hypothetical protein
MSGCSGTFVGLAVDGLLITGCEAREAPPLPVGVGHGQPAGRGELFPGMLRAEPIANEEGTGQE